MVGDVHDERANRARMVGVALTFRTLGVLATKSQVHGVQRMRMSIAGMMTEAMHARRMPTTVAESHK